METASPTLPADDADRLSEDLLGGTATVGAHSINRLGIDDVNRCRGDGVTLLAEERASAYRETWVMVNVPFETGRLGSVLESIEAVREELGVEMELHRAVRGRPRGRLRHRAALPDE
jgi:hypothetical protein